MDKANKSVRAAAFMTMAGAALAMVTACSGGGTASDAESASIAPPVEHQLGDGGVGAPQNAEPGGVYSGVVYSTLTNRTDDVVALVSESGDSRVYNLRDGSLYVMQISPFGNDFSTTVRFIPGGGALAASGPANGHVEPRDLITGTFTLANGGTGTLDLAYESASYELGSSLGSLAGQWTYGDPAGYWFALTIDVDGTMHGQDSRNCTLDGMVRMVDAAYNLYSMSVAEACGTVAASAFNGLAMLTPAADGEAVELLYVLSNTSAGYKAQLHR
jgi:hypothetical protein